MRKTRKQVNRENRVRLAKHNRKMKAIAKKKSENKKDSQLDASLKSVPVFTIALKGKIQKMPFKDEQVLLFFLGT